MKFLEDPMQTMGVGFALTVVLIMIYLGLAGIGAGEADWGQMILRWVHFLAGITWIGLLYFFNLINASFLKSLDGPTKNIVIPKLMPAALNWFRHGARLSRRRQAAGKWTGRRGGPWSPRRFPFA